MKPVIIGDATLYLGDCMDILRDIDRDSAVITDPPYGIGFRYESHDDTPDSFLRMMAHLSGRRCAILQYPEEMMRMVVPVLGAPDEVMAWVYGSNLPRQFRLWGFWGINADPSKSKQPARNPECSKVKSLMVSGYDWREIPQVKNTSSDKTAHPCQLPLACAEWVLTCVDEYLVVDPFMGSGTTGVACANLGRKFIGIEKEPKYFDIACQRIEAAYAQGRLFE